MIDANGTVAPEGYQFTPGQGAGSAQASLIWKPGCNIFQDNIFSNDYTFRFRTADDRCRNIKGDTVTINLNVKDVNGDNEKFLPPNIITPNDDGCNDYFAMEGFESDLHSGACAGVVSPHLPNDNCIGKFTSIRIYNRWGKQVFLSTQRNFKWHATNEAAGVYFYTIVYSHPENKTEQTEYKGSISVRF
jgi:hypothetical protein